MTLIEDLMRNTKKAQERIAQEEKDKQATLLSKSEEIAKEKAELLIADLPKRMMTASNEGESRIPLFYPIKDKVGELILLKIKRWAEGEGLAAYMNDRAPSSTYRHCFERCLIITWEKD